MFPEPNIGCETCDSYFAERDRDPLARVEDWLESPSNGLTAAQRGDILECVLMAHKWRDAHQVQALLSRIDNLENAVFPLGL
jgi:hypothetical protein